MMSNVSPTNKAYWRKRFEILEQSSNAYAKQAIRKIDPAFTQAERQIDAEITAWYQRFADNNKITMQEARKLLNSKELAELKWDIDTYIKYGEQNALDGLWMKELENASAKFHISRLEALKLRTQQAAEVAFGNELDEVDGLARKVLTEGYYHTAFELQKGMGVGWDIGTMDNRKLEKLLTTPWTTDGKTFSDRIWTSKQQLIGEVHNSLTRTCILGKAPDDAIKTISKKFGVSKSQAGRLVMTEQAYFHSVSQKEAFADLGVEQFEIVATLDSHTSEICQDMDGEHFDMKDYEPGVTAPPFHPWCRSVTCPYFDDDFGSVGERAARDEESGKTYYVPANVKYPEWKKAFVDGGSKSGFTTAEPGDIIKATAQAVIASLGKLKQSGMSDSDYQEYLKILNDHDNPDITSIYQNHADEISGVKFGKSGKYQPGSNSLVFDYPKYNDMNKYGTLAHEYGHFFDAKVQFDGLTFKEIDAVQKATGLEMTFPKVASSSDEFLEAIMKDKEYLKGVLTSDMKDDLLKHNASNGVQDAIDGLFSKSRLRWGHGEKYYNRKYADLNWLDNRSSKSSRKKALQQAYKDLGYDASDQAKTKMLCRRYEAASEMWANIMSAEVCGGESLKYVKLFLPNSYQAFLKILKGAM